VSTRDALAGAEPKIASTQRHAAVIAVLAVLVATALTALLHPLNERATFPLYYLAVLVVAAYGDTASTALSVGLSATAAYAFFLPPIDAREHTAETVVALGLFVGVAVVILVLVRRMRIKDATSFLHAREREHAESIAERETRFANTLIEAMPGIFYLYDETGRFLRWNRNFERVAGRTSEEIGRMHPLDFFVNDDKDLLRERIAEVFKQGESSVEASFVNKDGHATPYYFTGKRVALDDDVCLVGVGIDIEARERAQAALRASEARYRSTLDNILEGCQLIAFDWTYLYLNGAAAIQNRRPNDELLGKKMTDAWPGIEGSDVFALLRRCMDERIPNHEETEFAFPDGSKGWFDVRVQPVPEGIFVLSIDISVRKRAETLLRELNENLEAKVAERTLELESAKERAEAADRIKSAFLATMSHELRTPLNSIIGFTGVMLKGLAGPLNPEQVKQLGMVQGSARHLLDLINDVLDISKIEAGQLTVHHAPFDISAAVERVVSSVEPLARKKGLTLSVEASDLRPVESDRRRVEQILLNLLHNAIKFTERGAVTLNVDIVEGTNGEAPSVRMRVTDTGIGMREEDLPKLFQPFFQTDSGLGRQHEGTGLGLAISRKLTELLGGTIHAESKLGMGSTFTVSLPAARGTEP
jgi:PAS domain S-box-containing protein